VVIKIAHLEDRNHIHIPTVTRTHALKTHILTYMYTIYVSYYTSDI